MLLRVTASIFFVLFLGSSFAQVKVQVFDGNETAPSSDKNNGYVGDKNLITFNSYMLPRGIFSLGYERVFHSMHSLNINAGLTYRDFIFEAFNESKYNFLSGARDRTVKANFMMEGNYKFWPKHYSEFEGPYLSPGFAIKNYTMTDKIDASALYNYGSTAVSGVEQEVSYTMTEVYAKFGYMYESWWLDDVIVDIYCGFGLRNVQLDYYTIEEIPQSSSYSYTNTATHKVVPQSTQLSVPAVYLGAKIGIPF